MFKKTLFTLLLFSFLGASALAQDIVSFSFASDDEHDAPTFIGNPGKYFESNIEVDFMVDVNNNNTGGQVTFQATHILKAAVSDYQVVSCGSNYLHVWKVDGEIYINHLSAAGYPTLLDIHFEGGVLTAISPFWDKLTETLTLQVSESAASAITFIPQNLMTGIGVYDWRVDDSQDLAYTFTNLRNINGVSLVRLDPNGFFLEEWRAEGSFSASAQ